MKTICPNTLPRLLASGSNLSMSTTTSRISMLIFQVNRVWHSRKSGLIRRFLICSTRADENADRLLPAQASPKHDIVSSHSRFLQLRDLLMRFTIILKSNSVSEVAEDVKDNLTLISTVGVYNVSKEAAQLGFGLRPEFWGKRYGKEAVQMFLRFYWSPGSESFNSPCELQEIILDKFNRITLMIEYWRFEGYHFCRCRPSE